MIWRDCLPPAAGHRLKMSVLLGMVAVSGLLYTATAARQLQQTTLPTLAGQRSTWAPAPQYSQQRITVPASNVATAATAAGAVPFGQTPTATQPTSFATSVNPALARPPVASSFGGPGASFQGVSGNANVPYVAAAKPTTAGATANTGIVAGAFPLAPQTLQAQGNAAAAPSSSSRSSNSMDVTSRARLAAAVPSLPMLPKVGNPLSGLSSIGNSVSNTVTSATQGASASPVNLNPSQLVAVAAAGAQKFVEKDLPNIIQSAVKDPKVQKGVESFLQDLADGKLEPPEMPKTLGDVAKQLNLPNDITDSLSKIKIPENLIKLPDLKNAQLPKLELPKFNLPGLGNGAPGSKTLNLPQLSQFPGLNGNTKDKLSGTRWTNPSIPAVDSRGSTGVYSVDAARFMLGKSDFNPAAHSSGESEEEPDRADDTSSSSSTSDSAIAAVDDASSSSSRSDASNHSNDDASTNEVVKTPSQAGRRNRRTAHPRRNAAAAAKTSPQQAAVPDTQEKQVDVTTAAAAPAHAQTETRPATTTAATVSASNSSSTAADDKSLQMHTGTVSNGSSGTGNGSNAATTNSSSSSSSSSRSGGVAFRVVDGKLVSAGN